MQPALSGIQFIGTQRSGSNLLRVMMEQHNEISAPHPPHLLSTFMPLMKLYEPLNAASYRLLVSDIVDYTEANPVPWENVQFNKDDLFKRSEKFSLYEIFKLIYEQGALSKKARYWCCKSMASLYYTDEMEQFGLHPKYIYLYRDGRDVAVSFKKAIVGEKHIYHLAKQWKEEQAICIDILKRYGNSRVHLLNYEDLVQSPEASVKGLCSFLEIEYTEDMQHYYASSSSKSAAAAGDMWKNLEKPIIQNNTKKYLKELSDEEIEIFELVAHKQLTELGYPLHTSLTHNSLIDDKAIAAYNIQNHELKNNFMATAPQNDLDKRKAQLAIIKTIKERKK